MHPDTRALRLACPSGLLTTIRKGASVTAVTSVGLASETIFVAARMPRSLVDLVRQAAAIRTKVVAVWARDPRRHLVLRLEPP